jgi:hypothetical protein
MIQVEALDSGERAGEGVRELHKREALARKMDFYCVNGTFFCYIVYGC